MKSTLWMTVLAVGVVMALAGGCKKDEGTDTGTVGTDAGNGGTDAAFMCSMTGGVCVDWCTSYLLNCPLDDMFPAGYDMAMCMTDCAVLAPADVECRAYHACFAGKGGVADSDMHCDHAIGAAVCN
jgi:hypothetical protein